MNIKEKIQNDKRRRELLKAYNESRRNFMAAIGLESDDVVKTAEALMDAADLEYRTFLATH